jgi:lipopolysaccharide/colanic/teichoic acid biosynthesis glycosyltransferase
MVGCQAVSTYSGVLRRGLESVPGVTLVYRENPLTRRLRRALDIVLSATLLLLTLPVIAAAALAIRLEDGGPIFFTQRRAGRFERMFTIYKLRTMKPADCVDRPSPTSAGDDRITRVGRFLRKTSIDELPQLLNVFLGSMSLIGPRPEMALVIARYQRWQHLRHLVPPGITCIWQTSCRSTIPLDRPEATALDLEYIEKASPILDGLLLLRTVAGVLAPKGAF